MIEFPVHGSVLIQDGKATHELQIFFDAISTQLTKRIYTVANVPDASKNESVMIYIQDEAGGATIAFSDGTNWRRCADRNIVS